MGAIFGVEVPGRAGHIVASWRPLNGDRFKEALAVAQHILHELGVELHPQKTRIVHVRHGFEFLGYKIKRGARPLALAANKIRSGARNGALYAILRARSVQSFMDRVRRLTRRKVLLTTAELTQELNPTLVGWGRYFRRAHVRLLFNRLDRFAASRSAST